MSRTNSHPIRNSVIAGLIVAATIGIGATPARVVAKKALVWVWNLIVGAWHWLNATHTVPGWLIALSLPFVLFGLIRLLQALRPSAHPHLSYTEDYIRGAKWRWRWFDSQVIDLAAFCPRCDTRLVYAEYPYDRTDFICENCNDSVVWSCQGGQRSYAHGHILREIERKVRTNEFARSQQEPN